MPNEQKNIVLIKRKRCIQHGIRKSLETIVESLEEICEDYVESKYVVCSSLLDTLETESGTLYELNQELQNLIDDEEELMKEINDYIQFKIIVKKAVIQVRRLLNGTDSLSTVTATTRSSKSVKLPKLELNKFNGDPTKWKTFYDSFLSAVHNNDDISDIQKMTYLQSLLKGSASETIEGLSLSNENYKAALDILKDRFGNEQILISAHMNNLLKLEPIKSIANMHGLRRVYDNIETQVRSLRNLGVDSRQYGPMFIPILCSKIPNELNLFISRTVGKGVWDIDTVLKVFQGEIEAREHLNIPEVSPESDRRQYSTGTFYAENNKLQRNYSHETKFRCVFCNSDKHSAHECSIINDVKTRKVILQNKWRCFTCLKPKHTSKDCKSVIKCFNCGERHHAAMCMKNSKKERVNQSNSENVTSTSLSGSSKNIGLLQTAQATVCDTKEKHSAKLRILFDSGSQLSYITPETKKRLRLPVLEKSELLIKTFGNRNYSKVLEKVKVCVKGINGINVYVSALVSEICTPISGQFIDFTQHSYPHLQNLDLADSNPSGKGLDIDILIGSDFYWSFMSGKIVKPDNGCGPVALDSVLGYVLSGNSSAPQGFNSTNINFGEIVVLHVITESELLKNDMIRFWDSESSEINDEKNDVFQKFKKNISFKDKRYVVKLPFKEDFETIEDNFELSKNRLKSLSKKFKV